VGWVTAADVGPSRRLKATTAARQVRVVQSVRFPVRGSLGHPVSGPLLNDVVRAIRRAVDEPLP